MSKIKKLATGSGADNNIHKGYNEKNPTQPQGAFKADSMEQKKIVPGSDKTSVRKKRSVR